MSGDHSLDWPLALCGLQQALNLLREPLEGEIWLPGPDPLASRALFPLCAPGTVPQGLGKGAVVFGPPIQDVNQEGGLCPREAVKCKQPGVGSSALLLRHSLPLGGRLQQVPRQPHLRLKRP